jgi:OmpA-OmpF porin, OOP family
LRKKNVYETFVFENILFAHDSSYKVIEGAFSELNELGEYLKKLEGWQKIIIGGHTDSTGSDSYNLNLSQKRAEAVGRYLRKKFGFSSAKVFAIGYGESQPISDNFNFQGRRRNRRVEVKIIKPD